MYIDFIVPGEPKAKQRPKFGNGFAYTPKQTVNYENWVKQCYLNKNQEKKLEGEIDAEIYAYYSIPKSTSKKKIIQMENGEINPTKKPDTDNIAKIILDSLNGIAYKDDSQVTDLRVFKRYSKDPRVEVYLSEIRNK